MFYDRLKKVCAEKNTNMTTLSQKLKISSGNISKWKNGVVPKSETLILIAQELDISIDYLLTGKEKSLSPELSEDKQKLLYMYDLLEDIEKGEILGILKEKTKDRIEAKNVGSA